MKTNINGVSKKLTLGRGVTLQSNSKYLDVLQDANTQNLYGNVRTNIILPQQIQNNNFSSKTGTNFSYSNLWLGDSLYFVNNTTTLGSIGDGTTKVASLTLDISTLDINSVQGVTINDNSGLKLLNALPTQWEDLVNILNTYFSQNIAVYPYNVTLPGNNLVITNTQNAASLTKFSLIRYDDPYKIQYSVDDERNEAFLSHSGFVSLNNNTVTKGSTDLEEDIEVNRLEFQDSNNNCLGEVSSTYKKEGVSVTTITSENSNEEGIDSSSYIKLYTDNTGKAWTETITPELGDNSNKIATTAFVANTIAGGVIYKGTFDASAGNYDALQGSKVGWMYYVDGNGTINGIEWKVGDYLLVNEDDAANVTKIDNTESDDIVRLTATQTLTNKTLTSPILNGIPTAPTAAKGTRTTQLATTEFVANAITGGSGDYVDTTSDQTIDGNKTFLNGVKVGTNGTVYDSSKVTFSTDGATIEEDTANHLNINASSGVALSKVTSDLVIEQQISSSLNLINTSISSSSTPTTDTELSLINFKGSTENFGSILCRYNANNTNTLALRSINVTTNQSIGIDLTVANNEGSVSGSARLINVNIPVDDASNSIATTQWVQNLIPASNTLLHTTGNESKTGDLNLNGIMTFNANTANDYSIVVKSSRGVDEFATITTFESNQLRFVSKEIKRLGELRHYVDQTNHQRSLRLCYTKWNDDYTSIIGDYGLGIEQESDGNVRAWLNTTLPDVSSNDSHIATTQWVNTFANNLAKLSSSNTFTNINGLLADITTADGATFTDLSIKTRDLTLDASTDTDYAKTYYHDIVSDKNGNFVGYSQIVQYGNGNAKHAICAKAIKTDGSNATADISVQVSRTGVVTTAAPTPAVSDNSTQIATTAYINNKFQVVTALPENPDENTFYFIEE